MKVFVLNKGTSLHPRSIASNSRRLGVQAPGNSQSYNKYSYAFNNPLKYTDPTGYTMEEWATGVSVLTDVGLSINGQQSWTETGINTGVTIGAMIIGGWPGFIIQLDYYGAKTYMRTINEHPEWVLPPMYNSFTH